MTALLAGLVGSLSHCSVMCAPIVAAQMVALRTNKHPQYAMGYYHAGRISTYVGMGVAALYLSTWVFSGALQHYANILLIIAGMGFVVSAAKPSRTHHCTPSLPWVQRMLAPIRSANVVHFLRGVLMGFMPCGMTLAMLILVATAPNAAVAASAMLLFGVATTPILHFVGLGSLQLSKRHPEFSSRAGRSVMALNGLFLCGLGLNLVRVY